MTRREDFLGVRPFERHSLVLLVSGLVYAMIGVVQFLSEPTPARVEAVYYADRVLAYHYWGLVFVAIGLLTIVSARWPPVSETWGYTVMTGQSSLWSASLTAGVLFHGTDVVNLGSALVWGLIAFVWWAISGLVNPVSPSAADIMNENVAQQEENVELRKELDRVNREE